MDQDLGTKLRATKFLYNHVIPRTAAYMEDSHLNRKYLYSFSDAIHRHGVNLRHLKRLLSFVKSNLVRSLITTEMVARWLKNSLREGYVGFAAAGGPSI